MATDGTVGAAALRRLGEEGLVTLLRRRPDGLAVPPPVSLGELAERLATPAATSAALRRLDRPALQVAEAVVAFGGRVQRSALDRLFGAVDAPGRAAVDRALDRLRGDALLAGHDILQVTDTVLAVWRRPLGLGNPVVTWLVGRTSADLKNLARSLDLKVPNRKSEVLDRIVGLLTDPERVRAIVATAPADARELLEKAAAGAEVEADRGRYSSYGQPRTPKEWAVARGLLMRTSEWGGPLVMPAEVALALRGPEYRAPFEPTPSPPPSCPSHCGTWSPTPRAGTAACGPRRRPPACAATTSPSWTRSPPTAA